MIFRQFKHLAKSVPRTSVSSFNQIPARIPTNALLPLRTFSYLNNSDDSQPPAIGQGFKPLPTPSDHPTKIALVKKMGDEEIKILCDWTALGEEEEDPYQDNDPDDNEDFIDGPPEIDFQVVSQRGKESLLFECRFCDDGLLIEHVRAANDLSKAWTTDHVTSYSPYLPDLEREEDVDKFYSFLEDRGVNDELSSDLYNYCDWSAEAAYGKWKADVSDRISELL